MAVPMESQEPNAPPSTPRLRYAAHGLSIASELALPLPPASADPVDLEVSFGPVSPAECEGNGHRRKRIRDDMRYELVGGAKATLEPLPGAQHTDLAELFVNRLLTAAVYQRGWLPLHASAVETSQGVVAICGVSGMGKSTSAALLAARGGRLLADDMVTLRPDDLFNVPRGAASLKLTRASLRAVGRTPDNLALANSAEGKYRYPLAHDGRSEGRLCAMLHLCHGDGPAERLAPLDAMAAWPAIIKMPELMSEAPHPKAALRLWMNLVQHVPIYRVPRGKDVHGLERAVNEAVSRLATSTDPRET